MLLLIAPTVECAWEITPVGYILANQRKQYLSKVI